MDNCFLLLGKTGVGKSTLAKILSGDQTIIIGHSLSSETKESKCYKCLAGNFCYSIIDNPGYDDSKGNDSKNYADIKNYLISYNYKIKGIVLLFNFQETRFGESHIKGLEKIVNLIPLDNFWEYVIIVFNFTYHKNPKKLMEAKKQRLQDFKKIFNDLFVDFYKKYKIKKTNFDSIKRIFVDLDENETNIDKLKELISFFKTNSKYEPLYHSVKEKLQSEEVMQLDREDANKGKLYKVEYKIYEYYNQKGTLIKTISKPVSKEYIRDLNRIEFDGELQKNCIIASSVLDSLSGVFFGASGLIFFCPPAGIASLALLGGSFIVSRALNIIVENQNKKEFEMNKEFDEKKIIGELNIEVDYKE